MRLYAKPIINYNNINSFIYGNQWIIRAGDPNTLYFQLVDLDQNELRYMAGVSQAVSLSVIFPSIDDSKTITAIATQETSDKSIWKVSVASNQQPNSGNVKFSITEGSTTRSFSVLNMVSVEYTQNGSC